MVPVMRFRSHASGLFALDKSIKVRSGEYCGVRRNVNNVHGKLHGWFNLFSELSCCGAQVDFRSRTQQLHIICFIDANCIELLAPKKFVEPSQGNFIPGEHIGHISKNFAEILAPTIDKHYLTVSFQGHLVHSDTNHTRLGYDIDIIVLSNNTEEFNQTMFQKFCEMNLDPTRI